MALDFVAPAAAGGPRPVTTARQMSCPKTEDDAAFGGLPTQGAVGVGVTGATTRCGCPHV